MRCAAPAAGERESPLSDAPAAGAALFFGKGRFDSCSLAEAWWDERRFNSARCAR
jgi:hypothetical protein